MSELNGSTRARIRQTVIDGMDENEIRELVVKIHSAVDSGFDVVESNFEEYVGEVLTAREDDAEAVRP
jgi:hypothetical protein